MNIYLITRKDPEVIYDANCGFVIVAISEKDARILANEKCEDEGRIWIQKSCAKCKKIGDYIGKRKRGHIILIDYLAG